MEQLWSAEALRAHWVLTPPELGLLKGMSAQRRLVAAYLRLGRFDQRMSAKFQNWLIAEVLPAAPQTSALDDRMTAWFLANRVPRPGQSRLDKLTSKAERRFERILCTTISDRLSPQQKSNLDMLFTTSETMSRFAVLGRNPNGTSVKSVQDAVARLEIARDIGLSANLFDGIHPDDIANFARRDAIEDAWDMRRRPKPVRYTLLSCFCAVKAAELTDDLGDLVISITHKISARAESKVIKEYVADFRKVESKDTLLGKIAIAVDREPEGDIPRVIFPVVPRETIRELAQAYMADTPSFTTRVHRTIRRSYARHYRQVLPVILGALTFRASSSSAKPLLAALAALVKTSERKPQYYTKDQVPIEDVIRPKLRDIVMETGPEGTVRINRINYEICVLQTLRDKLRTKEIWIEGGKRYCDPDQDLPADFDERKAYYFDLIGQPTDADQFIRSLRDDLRCALKDFDKGFAANKDVKFKSRGGKTRISVRPLGPQIDPATLEDLKTELARRWPMTSLLDVLKEVDLRTGFTSLFRAISPRQALSPEEVSRRLLLALFGIGTNIGLKAISRQDRIKSATKSCSIPVNASFTKQHSRMRHAGSPMPPIAFGTPKSGVMAAQAARRIPRNCPAGIKI